jgi:aldose 1-epimerase
LSDLVLAAGDYHVQIDPVHGGVVTRFDWRGVPLFRPACGVAPLDSACFVLVPWSNRITHGRFVAQGRDVCLTPNFPGASRDHPLHGYGWLSAWQVADHHDGGAILHRHHAAGEWPWAHDCEQRFVLDGDGLYHELRVRNLAGQAMPAGLGFHPYFVRTAQARYLGRHRREWQVSDDCLPIGVIARDAPVDWWDGAPVGTRAVDTVYDGRSGDLAITWPEHALTLSMRPSDNLHSTVVYTPAGEDYFCVEPVSHATDAINRPDQPDGMVWLAPGETMTAWVRYSAHTGAIL